MALTFHATATGVVNTKGDHDWLRVSLEANTLYALAVEGLSSAGFSTAAVSVFDTNQIEYFGNFALGNEPSAFMTATAGTYYLDVSDYLLSGQSGNYTLKLYTSPDDYWNNVATSGVVAIGGTANAIIDVEGDEDWFMVNLSANTLYAVTSSGLTNEGASGVAINMVDANGVDLGADDAFGVGSVGFMPVTSGTYFIGASSASTGSYSIHVASSPDDFFNNTNTTGVVPVGGATSGVFNVAGDHDWFKVDLSANTLYGIEATGPAATGATLRLYDPSGAPLPEWFGITGTGPSGLMVSTAGSYYFDVGGSTTGSYTLNVTTSPDDYFNNTATTGTVAVGGTANGTVNLSGDHDWFKVNLTANTLYEVTAGSSLAFGFSINNLQVRGADGAALSALDTYGVGGAAGFMPMTSGTYFVDVSSGFLMPGMEDFTLSVAVSPDDYRSNVTTSGTVDVGGTVDGVINVVGDHDWFKLNLNANTLYAITVTGQDDAVSSPATLLVHDANGDPMPALDIFGSGSIGFMPVNAGVYFVDVGSVSPPENGAYTLQVVVSPDDFANNPGTTGLLGTASGVDTTAPIVTTVFPVSGATDVPVTSDITVNFDEAIQWGVGTITLAKSDGSVIETYNVANSTRLSISGNALTIDPTLDLANGTGYRIEFAAATVTDLAGNDYQGASTYSFTTTAVENHNTMGSANADTLVGTTGDDTLDGLGGTDTAQYSQNLVAYGITRDTGFGNNTITGSEGKDTLISIERLHFADINLAFDIDANAGQVFRLYQAAFNRTPDVAGLGGWIAAMDAGMSLEQIAGSFMESAEFQSLYGTNPSDETFVSNLYTNALHRPAQQDAVSAAGWVSQLATNQISRAQALVSFSESTENKASVLPAITSGIVYATTEQAAGLAQGQNYTGTPNADSFIGTVGRDSFTGGAGNDNIEGGRGLDTAVYSASQASYTITGSVSALTVSGGSDGSDTLSHVERLQFADGVLAFDLDGNAGQSYRLYQAAFNRTPDKGGLSDWVYGMDNGLTLNQMATAFISSDEFKGKYGANTSNAEFIDLLYANALHRAREEGDNYWTSQLDSGVTREQALIGFSESVENQAALIGVIEAGIALVNAGG